MLCFNAVAGFSSTEANVQVKRVSRDFKAITCPPQQKFNKCTDLEFTTSPAIALKQCCCNRAFFSFVRAYGKTTPIDSFCCAVLERFGNVCGFEAWI
jgi:hypothetical protein